ncbi:PREDICTED: uncharacterized protein LOC108371100 [Rhagoletis zephyria]|uniref:uncharacterized protein LOC108371100 n=1 Tax=Rhagoletis zephyria TaxID=28612 RepID=UPI00081127D0|nr:PREDICTED: uncharacterized protein LOC108371100 [Rhagoletis zephyria]
MPTTCRFKFSRTTPIYYSGEQITGSVILSTTKQLPVEAIHLSLVGCERVQWLARNRSALIPHNDSVEKEDNKELYHGKQEHLCESYTLAKAVRLLPGEVRLEEFCFMLPHDVPASCEMIYGEVVYYVRLVLQRKSVCNKVFKARITVKNRLDLSNATDLVEPHELTIPCVPTTSDEAAPLNFTLSTGTGYVPGQSIFYTLYGRHKFAACNRLRVNLCQLSTFRASKPQTKTKELLKVLKSNTHKIGSSYVTVCGQLSIPLVAHITLKSNENNLIQISHFVEAMLINKKHILQKLIIPIVIGTVPPKRKERTPEEKSFELLEHFYCYDNLATDEICDTSIPPENKNNSLTSANYKFLQKLPCELLLDSYDASANMLQQHVA